MTSQALATYRLNIFHFESDIQRSKKQQWCLLAKIDVNLSFVIGI